MSLQAWHAIRYYSITISPFLSPRFLRAPWLGQLHWWLRLYWCNIRVPLCSTVVTLPPQNTSILRLSNRRRVCLATSPLPVIVNNLGRRLSGVEAQLLSGIRVKVFARGREHRHDWRYAPLE